MLMPAAAVLESILRKNAQAAPAELLSRPGAAALTKTGAAALLAGVLTHNLLKKRSKR